METERARGWGTSILTVARAPRQRKGFSCHIIAAGESEATMGRRVPTVVFSFCEPISVFEIPTVVGPSIDMSLSPAKDTRPIWDHPCRVESRQSSSSSGCSSSSWSVGNKDPKPMTVWRVVVNGSNGGRKRGPDKIERCVLQAVRKAARVVHRAQRLCSTYHMCSRRFFGNGCLASTTTTTEQ